MDRSRCVHCGVDDHVLLRLGRRDPTGDPRVDVEATATSRVSLVRVRGFGTGGLVLDQPDGRGRLTIDTDTDGQVQATGWVAEGDPGWGNAPRMFFAGQAQAAHATAYLMPDADHPDTTGAVLGHGELELRVATSFLSVAQAWRNLRAEAPWEMPFDELCRATRAQWDEVCSAIEVPASGDQRRTLADEELRAQIAGNLYRLHLYPNDASENTGTADAPDWRFADMYAPAGPHGDESTGAPIAAGRLVVNNGYWDTYRTVWPMLNLLDAPVSGALLDGQLEQARRGGWMTRWSAPGYVDCMVGTSSDQIFADAHAWEAPGLSAAEAFETGGRNACEPSADRRAGRAGTGVARFTGYVPTDVHEGFSWSIESAISDAGLARFADRLADGATGSDAARYRAFARYFANRSLAWRQLFDADSGFLRGRDRDGAFAPGPFDPRVWGGDYVETNAWGMSVSPVHDGAGLAALHGGPAGLRAHLDRLFAEPETADAAFGGSYGGVIHEQREARAQRSGMCALSNQPAHHIPYMHVHGDEPWRAGTTAHALARRLFVGSHIGQGYPGDEDNGEMSAWWLFALMGLYPLELASGELVIGDPLMDDVSVRRADGGTLRVVSRRSAPEAHALRAVTLNGRRLSRAVLPIADLTGSDVLDLEFGTEPEASLWPAGQARAWHPDLATTAHAVMSVAGGAAVFDDLAGGEALVALHSGDWVGQDFGAPTRVTDLTLTVAADAGAGALVVERSDDGEEWKPVPLTHAEPLPADRTTPFQVSEPAVARFWRVRATASVVLRQVEFFLLDR